MFVFSFAGNHIALAIFFHLLTLNANSCDDILNPYVTSKHNIIVIYVVSIFHMMSTLTDNFEIE